MKWRRCRAVHGDTQLLTSALNSARETCHYRALTLVSLPIHWKLRAQQKHNGICGTIHTKRCCLPACRTDLFGLAWRGVSVVTLTYSLTPGQNGAFNRSWDTIDDVKERQDNNWETAAGGWLVLYPGSTCGSCAVALKDTEYIYCGVARWSSVAADHCHRLTLHTRTYTTNAHGLRQKLDTRGRRVV